MHTHAINDQLLNEGPFQELIIIIVFWGFLFSRSWPGPCSGVLHCHQSQVTILDSLMYFCPYEYTF